MTRALFVDDDHSMLIVYRIMCQADNIEYHGLQHVAEIDSFMAKQIRVDVICIDIKMPLMNGYEVLQKFRSSVLYKSLPIVACSVHDDELPQVRDAGFSSFIIKPFSAARFMANLNFILNGQAIWETNSQLFS